MFQNYFKIALRNLLRSKTYSLINILGLSLGIACCLLLALYIQDEYKVDKHHERLDDIYRLVTEFHSEDGIQKQAATSPPIAMTLADEIPEVEFAARVLSPPGVPQNLIRYGDNMFYETNGYVADSSLFDILTIEFAEGNPRTALVNPNSVVITDEFARKLFGQEGALEKVIAISQGGPMTDYKVTGVIRQTLKSHFAPHFIVSMTSAGGWGEYIRTEPSIMNEWAGNNFIPGYLKLVPGHDKAAVEKKMNDILTKYGAAGMKAMGFTKTLSLEPVRDIHLVSDIGRSPRIIYLYVIACIAVFILLIACINFMNLSTAKASKRATEIGIRKVLGAFRSSLIKQVMGEALVIVFISILVSIVLVQLTLPFFNRLTSKFIVLDTPTLIYGGVSLALIGIITSALAGSYPSLYLSSFQPARVLKGKVTLSHTSGWLRQSLVVFQFVIAIALVCGMLVISDQLTFMQEKDLGFDADAKIVLPLRTRTARTAYSALLQQLQKNGDVLQVSGAQYPPGTRVFNDMLFYPAGGNMDNAIQNDRNRVDFGYLELLGIKLVAGRSFTENRVMEDHKVILNRTSAKRLGFEPEQIIGQSIFYEWHGEKSAFEVIGVMEDYHQTSLKDNIKPLLFEVPQEADRYLFVIASVKTANFASTISAVEKVWKSAVNDTPFEYTFLDESIKKLYDEDRKVASIISTFTGIAMAICCLGLYGLSSFMAERRFKEIGIRKVMGASLQQIVGMMSQEFVKLVLIAFFIGAPLAWVAINRWLDGFAYQVPFNGWIFVYAGAAAMFVALATVSFESLKAASANPVQSLRNE